LEKLYRKTTVYPNAGDIASNTVMTIKWEHPQDTPTFDCSFSGDNNHKRVNIIKTVYAKNTTYTCMTPFQVDRDSIKKLTAKIPQHYANSVDGGVRVIKEMIWYKDDYEDGIYLIFTATPPFIWNRPISLNDGMTFYWISLASFVSLIILN
jgi:hypothetical protein